MAIQIQPTGNDGKQRVVRRQAQKVRSQLDAAAWNELTAAQRWEIVRRVLLFVLNREFND